MPRTAGRAARRPAGDPPERHNPHAEEDSVVLLTVLADSREAPVAEVGEVGGAGSLTVGDADQGGHHLAGDQPDPPVTASTISKLRAMLAGEPTTTVVTGPAAELNQPVAVRFPGRRGNPRCRAAPSRRWRAAGLLQPAHQCPVNRRPVVPAGLGGEDHQLRYARAPFRARRLPEAPAARVSTTPSRLHTRTRSTVTSGRSSSRQLRPVVPGRWFRRR